SQNPPEPPVLVSMRWLTSLSSPNLGRAPASTSCVSSVLALSTTTMRHGGVVIVSILSSNSAKYPERLNVTIAIAIFGAERIGTGLVGTGLVGTGLTQPRSEEHTSELQSRFELVCRLLRDKKN